MTHWRMCPVKGTAWDITNYIEDSMTMAVGTFRGVLQFSLRLLAEYVCLGFSLNLNVKSQMSLVLHLTTSLGWVSAMTDMDISF